MGNIYLLRKVMENPIHVVGSIPNFRMGYYSGSKVVYTTNTDKAGDRFEICPLFQAAVAYSKLRIAINQCQRALSAPHTKTSSHPPHGVELKVPPRDSHSDHFPPSYHLCHRALSVPRPKTSSRPEFQEAAAGVELKPPPRDSHSDHPPL